MSNPTHPRIALRMPRSRRFITPHVVGTFCLVGTGSGGGAQGAAGPLNAKHMVVEEDGAVVFLTDGLPVRLAVVSQHGALLTLHDGTRVRIEPC